MNKNIVLYSSILCFIGFLIIALNLNNVSILSYDSNISNFVINHQNNTLNKICSLISITFEPIYVIVFVFFLSALLWIMKYKKESIFLASTSACAGIAIYIMKHLFIRTRPLIQFLQETGYSFPSGHSLISVILFGSLLYLSLRLKSKAQRISLTIISILGILILGLSRVYLNVHWISDIIGGYLLGATILFVGIYLLKQNE